MKVPHSVHKSSPIVPIVSYINPVHALYNNAIRSILILPSHLGLRLPSALFPSGFLTKTLHTTLLSPILPIVPIVSYINPVQALYHNAIRSILILPSHLGLGLPSALFPSGFLTKTQHTTLLSPLLPCEPSIRQWDRTSRCLETKGNENGRKMWVLYDVWCWYRK